jgi:hypothetical protein
VTTDSVADSPEETPTPPSTLPAAASVSEPYREPILNGLARGRNAMSIFQKMVNMVSPVPTRASSASSANCAGPLLQTLARSSSQSLDMGRKWTTAPAPPIRDPNTGKYRRSRLFVFTLGYSRKCVRLLTFQSSMRIWAELNARASANSAVP